MMLRPGLARFGGCSAMPRCATIYARVGSRARLVSAMIVWHAQRPICMRESSICNLRTLVRISSVVVHSLLPLLYRAYGVGVFSLRPSGTLSSFLCFVLSLVERQNE